jgi:uncharacterized protein (TIGR02271 family)
MSQMPTTVIGTIETPKIAQRLIDELTKAGFKSQDVQILKGDQDDLVAEIVELGFGKSDASGYAKAVRNGKTVVTAAVAEDKVAQAAAIFERYEAAEDEEAADLAEETTLTEVKEELSVGKSKGMTGGVRATTSVSEQPVEKTVTLREEHVEVERQPTERKLKPEEAEAAFTGKTVEMLGTTEEVEVAKEAYVTEEVTLSKRVEEHQEKVRDTVRHTDVEVEKIKPGAAKKR